MKKSKKTLKMLIICIICIAAVVVINMVKKPSDPFQSSNNKLGYQHIEKENLLNNQEEDGDSYYIYFYKVGCPYCEEVDDDIKEYARSHSAIYFVNMDEKSKDYKKFDWNKFHEENDIEIGKVKSNGKIEYYEGESKEKYTKSKEKDEYGKTKRYEIKKADKEYLKTNKKARKGYVYASLETPNIDYYTLTSEDDVTIAGVPTLLHVKDNKIDKFYFDSVEIKPAMEKLNKD